jgi:uncharacterized protein (DUF427 family)
MSEYTSCSEAIRNYKLNQDNANVSKNSENVTCSRLKTQCDWKGNGIHFTCLNDSNTLKNVVNVYDTLSSGNMSRITKPN